ncbi:hypothetical protein M231_04375 [Tremella mesenterica]|uniref:Uncharacterized protein n=1 Tax=Tremella mesenterica TaxID=5217 RepID=A0A4Q1BKN0_TREME|nr:hypothetical protein M231_04375 [Tremella mesenterica]
MISLLQLLTTLALVVYHVSAYSGVVTGFKAPKNLRAATPFKVTVDFIDETFAPQTDYGIVWGLRSEDEQCTNCVGRAFQFTDLNANTGDYQPQLEFSLEFFGAFGGPLFGGGNFTLVAAVTRAVTNDGIIEIGYYTQKVQVARTIGPIGPIHPTFPHSFHPVSPTQTESLSVAPSA